MVEFSDSFLFKIRLLVGTAIIAFALMLLPLFVSLIVPNPKVQAANSNSATATAAGTDLQDSPNIITSGLFSASDNIGKTTNSFANNVNNSADTISHSFISATAQSGEFVAHGVGASAKFIATGIGGGASLMAQGVANSFMFGVHTTGSVIGFVGKAPVISSIIKPADSMKLPEIKDGEQVPDLAAAAPPVVQAPAKAPAPAPVDTSAQWPIHGIITTEFWASDWPYQLHHTGIDIADGKPSGTTPIHPFRSGKVVQVIHSTVSLGNHIVVDNGNGVTSVYGHMYNTNVQVGQQVDKNSVLGWVGSTGASTGPHVHFEIYLNGTLQNPHNYIPGKP
jgi:murein DD-endopeptidase MepM/ murein hydrolase activator NlpD